MRFLLGGSDHCLSILSCQWLQTIGFDELHAPGLNEEITLEAQFSIMVRVGGVKETVGGETAKRRKPILTLKRAMDGRV